MMAILNIVHFFSFFYLLKTTYELLQIHLHLYLYWAMFFTGEPACHHLGNLTHFGISETGAQRDKISV
jgi:hypothetical protein